MKHICKFASLAASVALLSGGPAFTQSLIADDEPDAAAPVAYVYVQTTKGVNLYDAATNGKLTLAAGSPFEPVGAMVGSNGKYFITLSANANLIRTYAVELDGAIGKQVAEINTQHFKGGTCSEDGGINYGTRGAVLDHTGQSLYVVLDNGGDDENDCAAYQTFSISKAGDLAYESAAILYDNRFLISSLPTIMLNEKFAYAAKADQSCNGLITTFAHSINGSLELTNLNEDIGNVELVAEDPSNHLAAEVVTAPDGCAANPPQLQSFTVAADGNISSINSADKMPHPKVWPTILDIDPLGKLLAVAGRTSFNNELTTGLQIFHFNGAEEITADGAPLTTDPIYQIHWDESNHVYALGASKLYEYTVTPTSIAEVPGSPFSLNLTNKACSPHAGAWWACPNALVVVSKH